MLFSILFIQIQAFDDFLIAFLHKEKVFLQTKGLNLCCAFRDSYWQDESFLN